jgi:C4-dicarboxylate-binding protein DctP
VFTPADLEGHKFRSYESEPANALREALGTIPVYIRWKESYEAFRQGLIEAFLSPTVYLSALNLHEVAQYTTIIDYGYTQNLVMAISEREYQKLPPSVQQVLNEALQETSEYYHQTVRPANQINLERLSTDYGIPVIHPDPNIWRARYTAAIRQICDEYGFLTEEMYQALQEI